MSVKLNLGISKKIGLPDFALGGGSSSAAFFPNGERLAIAGNKMEVWNTKTGRPVFRLEGHRQGGRAVVAVSSDNRLIATGGNDKAVAIWNASNGEPVVKIGTFGKPICALSFSPDNSALAVAENWRGNVFIIDAKIWKPMCYLSANGDWNCQTTWHSNGKQLLIGGNEAQIWYIPSQTESEQWEQEREKKIEKANNIFLTEMTLDSWKVCDWVLENNGPYQSEHKEFENSLWAHAPSNHTCRLQKKWKTFKTSYGIKKGANLSQTNAVFIVKGDDNVASPHIVNVLRSASN